MRSSVRFFKPQSLAARPDRHFDRFLVGTEAGVLVDKSLMVVAVV
jgi:hypothetical protein